VARNFESTAWQAAVAAIIDASTVKSTFDGIDAAIDAVVCHEGTCVIAFSRDHSPDVLHHTLEPAGRRHYLDRYLDGPYLLDPLYELALQCDDATLCRFREELPDRFRSSEYYRQYCERTHLRDEMDYLIPVSKSTTVVLVIGRRKRMFARAELSRLKCAAPVLQAAIRRGWSLIAETAVDSGKKADRRSEVHQRLTHCMENFGSSVLTDREREISQLLLRGHSSKSVARVLGIAPGTVMVHKRNLFAKLDISSQYELFSLLIDELQRA